MNADTARYSGFAIALHWLMAVLIVGLIGVGVWMSDLKPSPQTIKIYTWHKWIGLTVLLLAVVRLIWRAYRRPPPVPASLPRWQARAAGATQGALYALLFAMPLTGWLQNSAAGFPLTWFGLFKVPALIERNRDAFEWWQDAHETLAWLLMALIALHVAAAIKHHLIDRDDVLRRMLPARRRPAPPDAPVQETPQ